MMTTPETPPETPPRRPPSRTFVHIAALAAPLALASCSGANASSTRGGPSVLAAPGGAPIAGIEVHALDERPRLTLVNRDGDPAPAIAVAFATDPGPATAAALSALVEARLVAAGFETRVRADRTGFRVEWLVDNTTRITPFFTALVRAMRDPVVANGPETPLVTRRLVALRKTPLDAPELAAIAACTGRLGLSPSESMPDPASPTFAGELEGQRREGLHTGRASIASVGPASFGVLVAKALEASEGWPVGEPAADPFPTADTVASYVAPPQSAPRGQVTLAVRLGDALGAVAIAERLAAPGSPLHARLGSLPDAFHAVEVVGVARARGGCVSVTIEPDARLDAATLERAAARAAAITRHEIRLESAVPTNASVAMRQILSAADPRDAASRAAWWDLTTPVPAAPPRVAVALALPPRATPTPGSSGRTFAAELDSAWAKANEPVVERRAAVERGQGELWALVASPCGVVDEGATDAGVTALAMLAASASREPSAGVALEPWVGPDGVGLVAHAAPRDEHETPVELARRVGDAAARALSPAALTPITLTEARTSALAHLERTTGRGGVAFEALASALVPEHPSWLDPLGIYTRVSGAGLEGTRLRLRTLLEGPLRLAVLANADAAQATELAQAVDRWLVPRPPARACPMPTRGAPRTGPLTARLARDAGLAQALLAAPMPAVGASGHDLALFVALALGGEGGLLEAALPPSGGVRATARIVGTTQIAALVVDVRAPSDLLASAVNDVRALLGRLSRSGLGAPEFNRAAALVVRRDTESRADPRRRLIHLWSGRSQTPRETPTAQAITAFLATSLAESALLVVEAHPDP